MIYNFCVTNYDHCCHTRHRLYHTVILTEHLQFENGPNLENVRFFSLTDELYKTLGSVTNFNSNLCSEIPRRTNVQVGNNFSIHHCCRVWLVLSLIHIFKQCSTHHYAGFPFFPVLLKLLALTPVTFMITQGKTLLKT